MKQTSAVQKVDKWKSRVSEHKIETFFDWIDPLQV